MTERELSRGAARRLAVDQALGVGEHRQSYKMLVLAQGIEP